MSLERIDSVDPSEVYDYIICGYAAPILCTETKQALR